ncbi:hypothetical protein [Aneurinibacillus migulanus]|uniref:CopG family transcriptional regulator n=1 Tax=Aneurinibacillus migulanus TaxID=47500 RepID=A0A0D1WG25_ANEMI|nr:hypothetical protein [Aneurinibacillus migulanus]KIV57490.1 hypothetical protein TS65_09660 [Aneurinibacillus migulanus]KON94899.1 hypothetical protein AF333_04765 [Aneurinibacillus migulanus]MCP1355105.1 hypothetical protein [Aneurinibacillus migulanus]MED0892826.1 hypothetical protein [Aneurinibacillus migulanus]MED1619072.1 hypothetical protein [Aneurinibacillus migulanus]
MAKKTRTYRLHEETIELLKAWSFITEKDQQDILEEAFLEYAKQHPELHEKAKKVIEAVK